MDLLVIITVLFTVTIAAITFIKLRGFKFDTRKLTRIGIVATIGIVLYMIKLVPFPQGGGCSLLSILPIMILAVIAGTEEALICALVVGFLKIVIQPPYFPLQIPLDYLGGMVAVGFTAMFGTDRKEKLFIGALVASSLSVLFSIFSGAIFFGQFAPADMSPIKYSTIYNLSGYGVEALLSSIVLVLLPLKKFKELVKI